MSKVLEALEKAKREGSLDEALWLESGGRPAPPPVDLAEPRRSALRERRTLPRAAPASLGRVDARVLSLHDPGSVITEQYRVLRGALFGAEVASPPQVLAVTSAVKSEGKSLTVTNLALTVAQDGTKGVLLVDADLRRPTLHQLLGLPTGPGLGECLSGTAAAEEIIRETPFFGLSFVPAGSVVGQPAELLGSPEFEAFVRYVRSRFDVVLFDTPPVYPLSDVKSVTAAVDGIMLVVRAGKTPRRLLQHALESLQGDKILGTVLNRAEDLGPGYRRYGYGHGYGYGYGYGYGDGPPRPSWSERWKSLVKRGRGT